MMIKEKPHDNIVRFYDSHLVNDELWVLMEFVDGGSLTNIIKSFRSVFSLTSSLLN